MADYAMWGEAVGRGLGCEPRTFLSNLPEFPVVPIVQPTRCNCIFCKRIGQIRRDFDALYRLISRHAITSYYIMRYVIFPDMPIIQPTRCNIFAFNEIRHFFRIMTVIQPTRGTLILASCYGQSEVPIMQPTRGTLMLIKTCGRDGFFSNQTERVREPSLSLLKGSRKESGLDAAARMDLVARVEFAARVGFHDRV